VLYLVERKDISLHKFQYDIIRSIYHVNKIMEFGSSYAIYAHLEESLSDLSESMRKREQNKINEQEAKNMIAENTTVTLKRMLCLANFFEVDVEEAVWDKYPNVCPYCLHEENCRCGKEEPIYENRKDEYPEKLDDYRKKQEAKPRNLYEFQLMSKRIYGNVNKEDGRESLRTILDHVFEEAGEISKAIRMKDRGNLRNEFADFFMWIVAFANELGIEDFGKSLWRLYPGKCRKCGNEKCECKAC
jgi:NTP pyrophosphatase (non-canonical NTP hydrolase)